MKKIFTILHLSIYLIVLSVFPLSASSTEKLYTAWLGENETFITWYAQKKELDKKAGFDLKMMPFETGKTILESLSPLNWAIAGCGIVPILSLQIQDSVEIIAVASNESKSNAIYVRPDSRILKIKGYNSDFPNIYGSPETIKKIKILCPLKSSAHYLLANWLQGLGLTPNDIHLQHMEHSQALSAFTGGDGDAVALWAPLTYEASQKGFKEVANSQEAGIPLYTVLIANKKFSQKYPQKVTAFLNMYLDTVSRIQSIPEQELIAEYINFYKEWSGKTLSAEMAKNDLLHHRNFTLQEQIKLFSPENTKGIQQILKKTARFISTTEKSTFPATVSPKVTDKYLKILSEKNKTAENKPDNT